MNANILFFLISVTQVTELDSIKISTFNAWNTMFNWNVRKIRTAEMIKQSQVDVIAFQEVRSHALEGNQLLELKSLLSSQYKWHIFKVANNVTFPDDAIDKHLNTEGLGIITRLPIIDSSVSYLVPSKQDPDKNKRVLIHVSVKDTTGIVYNIIVLHLSYHRQQQCSNVADLITFIKRKQLQNVILVGDFNTYNDYEWPVKMLTVGASGRGRGNRCYRTGNKDMLLGVDSFKDAWLDVYPETPGLTFSNMPSPGFESRPDRVIVSSNLHVQTIQLLGNGSRYKQKYKASIHWSRFVTILQSARLSHQAISGYPCQQDCGPHGSCQCGVCVAGGNNKNCKLPDCDICNATVYQQLVIFSVISFIIFFHFCYAIILVLTIGAGSYGNTVYSIFGCNCCLFNPDLCKRNVQSFRRRNRLLRMCNLWPLFRLPPYVQLLVSVLLLGSSYFYFRYKFDKILDITYKVLDEELFPSDHLMVIADIT